MKEKQSKNTGAKGMSLVKTFAVAALAAVLSGCVSYDINRTADVMGSADSFRDKIKSIEPGDTYGDVYKKLDLDAEQFETLTAEMDDKQAYEYIYGDVNPETGTRAEAYDRIEGYILPYENVKTKKKYDLLYEKKKTTGDRINTTIIFDGGQVVNNPGAPEEPVNKRSKDSYLNHLKPSRIIF